jgi:tRNA modification GTPase
VLDLARAEGLADLLNAETAAQRRQALAAADGSLARRAQAWRSAALRCLAHAEAAIDFGEDAALGDNVAAGVAPAAAALRAELAAELARSGWAPPADDATASLVAPTPRAELVRSGVRVALGGAPNAGKSSLLNCLAGREAAIVSPRAGTTRDALPVGLELGGHKLVVTDTAGLREAELTACNELEIEGMRRARAALATAHVRLLVLDAAALATSPPGEAEWGEALLQAGPQQLLVVALNKADLLTPEQRAMSPMQLLPPWLERRCAAEDAAITGPWLLSCATGDGVDALCGALRAAAQALLGADAEEPHAVTRARHAAALRDAVLLLDAARDAASAGADELAAEELRAAASALGRLTGVEVGTEDVLDVIFSEFCIGK